MITGTEVHRLVVRLIGDSGSYRKMLDGAKQAATSTAKQIQTLGAKIESLGPSLMKFGGAMKLFVTAPLVAAGAFMIKAASDAEEVANKFEVTFSRIQGRAEQMTKTLEQSYGMTGGSAKRLMTDTGDLLTGFGFTQEAAADLSFQVQKLAADLASFTNIEGGAERASIALTRGLLGEREMMKLLGIAILEKDVKAKIEEQRAKGITYETERQAKAYATLQIAMEQSKNALGAYGRESQSFANQLRVLGGEVHDLKIEFGKLLLPLGIKLVEATRGAVAVLTAMPPIAKGVVLAVGGITAAIGPAVFALGTLIWSFKQLVPVVIAATNAMAAFWGVAAGPFAAVVAAAAAAVAALAYAYKGLSGFATDRIRTQTLEIETQTLAIKQQNDALAEQLGIQEGLVSAERRAERNRVFVESATSELQRLTDQLQEMYRANRQAQESLQWWHVITTLGRPSSRMPFPTEQITATKKRIEDLKRNLDQATSPEEIRKDPWQAAREFARRQNFDPARQWRQVQLDAINAARVEHAEVMQQQYGHLMQGLGMLPGAVGGRLGSIFGQTRQGLAASLGAMFFEQEKQVQQPRILNYRALGAATRGGTLESQQRSAQIDTQIAQAKRQEERDRRRERQEDDANQKRDALIIAMNSLATVFTGQPIIDVDEAEFR